MSMPGSDNDRLEQYEMKKELRIDESIDDK